ncbi:hypothetical protein DB347_06205 [Opitutaceae bacterium EW11]|nr:hypothetical protein DB347_06205 [Opitutaceae bacterium EW11]
MNPSDLVQEIGERLNLTGLTLNDGICRLVFDNSLPIDIEDDDAGNLCFHSVLAPLPHDGRESLLAGLLSAHLFGIETDGAVFGLHPRTEELYLFRTLPVEGLEVEPALDALERFTHQVETWKRKIEALARGAADTPVPSDESEPLASEGIRA